MFLTVHLFHFQRSAASFVTLVGCNWCSKSFRIVSEQLDSRISTAVIKSTLQCADERLTTTEVEIEVSTIDAVRICRGSLLFQCLSILFVYMDTKRCAVSIASPAARLQRRVRRVGSKSSISVVSGRIWTKPGAFDRSRRRPSAADRRAAVTASRHRLRTQTC
jgi:hypothetical protein